MRKFFILKSISLFLLIMLSGCTGNLVSESILRQSITAYLNYTQIELTNFLNLPMPSFDVRSVHVHNEEAFLKNSFPTYHLTGTYEVSLKFPHQTIIQKQNPFDLYLQQQSEGKSWRLLIPAHRNSGLTEDETKQWESYLVTPDSASFTANF